ncbi:hypothetical protein BD414DRAFT_494458 [Trametes punicea]|nr:hypothetical protein BD414DRAFT_494458 [Trametes punicea]
MHTSRILFLNVLSVHIMHRIHSHCSTNTVICPVMFLLASRYAGSLVTTSATTCPPQHPLSPLSLAFRMSFVTHCIHGAARWSRLIVVYEA